MQLSFGPFQGMVDQLDGKKGMDTAAAGAKEAQKQSQALSQLQWQRQMQGLQMAQQQTAPYRSLYDRIYGTQTAASQPGAPPAQGTYSRVGPMTDPSGNIRGSVTRGAPPGQAPGALNAGNPGLADSAYTAGPAPSPLWDALEKMGIHRPQNLGAETPGAAPASFNMPNSSPFGMPGPRRMTPGQ